MPKDVEKDMATSRGEMGAAMGKNSRLVRGDGSREHTDLDSDEDFIADAHEAGLPGQRVTHSRGDQAAVSAGRNTGVRRKAPSGGADELNGVPALGGSSRELLDQTSTSLEYNNDDGRPAAVNVRDTDYDGKRRFRARPMRINLTHMSVYIIPTETREHISSEAYGLGKICIPNNVINSGQMDCSLNK